MEGKIAKVLIDKGYLLFNSKTNNTSFTQNPEADALIKDIDPYHYPHAFLLACLMDRKIKAEKAWSIPLKIKTAFQSFSITDLMARSLEDYVVLFNNDNLHRFNDVMAEIFYNAIKQVHSTYKGDASQIWSNKPCSASVVYRFLQFQEAGIKIAIMAANILARDFKVPMSDHYSIDVSPDTHVKRVFRRLGFINEGNGNDEIIYKARELNPDFPGILDLAVWEIGRYWCKPKTPECEKCYLVSLCPKLN